VPSWQGLGRLIRSGHARKQLFAGLTRRHFYRVAHLYTPVLLSVTERYRFLVSTRDPYIGRDTFLFGPWEAQAQRESIAELRRRFPEEFDLRGTTVVEIGANIGTQTIPFAKEFGAARVIAVEADPANALLLRQNAIGNDAAEIVKTLNVAASDRNGWITLGLSPTNPGDHRVSTDGDPEAPQRQSVEIQSVRIDTLIDDEVFAEEDVSLMWVDVQGHEGHVLAGATRLLARGTPIVCEYWPDGLRSCGGLDLFHELVAQHYTTVVDLQSPWPDRSSTELPSDRVDELAGKYRGPDDAPTAATDLLLLRDPLNQIREAAEAT